MIRVSSITVLFTVWIFNCKGEEAPNQHKYFPSHSEWNSMPPEQLDLDTKQLTAIDAYLQTFPTEAFIIIRHGYIAFEKYYNDFTPDQAHNGYSMAKSFTSAAIGVCIKNGLIPSVNSKLSDYISAEDANTPTPDLYNMITIKHLLTMTSGRLFIIGETQVSKHEWDEYLKILKRGNWDEYLKTLKRGNSLTEHFEFSLKLPIVYQPGSHFKYGSDPEMLSAVVSKVTNSNMFDYVKQQILTPIGITGDFRWGGPDSDLIPTGHTWGSGGIYTTARNFARFGLLYLNKGKWQDQTILPEDYVTQSTFPCNSPKRTFCNCWSRTPTASEPDSPFEYGYAWWCRKLPDTPADLYYAFGGRGQFIIIIPSLDIVAVRLANEPRKGQRLPLQSDLEILPELARLITQAATYE
jgi:CubicO group peptidase (beta-lactamase class C family)